MQLYHFSEDPTITHFEPRVPPGGGTPVVWAIDDARQVTYYFPRDCPRACYWPDGETTYEDRDRFFAHTAAPMIIAVESSWLDRIRTATLYRYEMPGATFAQARGDDSGHHVSPEVVSPLGMERIDDLIGAVAGAGIELHIMPSLVALWRAVIASSLQFSGTRLRNATGWDTVDWPSAPLGGRHRRDWATPEPRP
jgi:hypothetical protein